MKKIAYLLFLIVSFTACTPVIRGASPDYPLFTDNTQVIRGTVQPGATWYVANKLFLDGFDEENANTRNTKEGKYDIIEFSDVKVLSIDSPQNWQVELKRIYLRQEPFYRDGRLSFLNSELFGDYLVTIPQNTDDGLYKILVNVEYKEQDYVLPLTIKVQLE
jgi:hypothetical protein